MNNLHQMSRTKVLVNKIKGKKEKGSKYFNHLHTVIRLMGRKMLLPLYF